MTSVCPYCRSPIEGQESAKICQACGTPHHQDCFIENAGCTVFGCLHAPGDEPMIKVSVEDLDGHASSLDRRDVTTTVAIGGMDSQTSSYFNRQSFRNEAVPVKPGFGVVLGVACPPPPSIPWFWLLVCSMLSSGLFLLIWELILARWMRQVRFQSRASHYYSALSILLVVGFASMVGGQMNSHDVPVVSAFGLACLVTLLTGRFSMERSLEDHFEQTGLGGLCLSEAMTFFFGGIYFQYLLNRFSRQKQIREQAIA